MRAVTIFLEVAFIVALIVFVGTQLLLPALRGTALFPMFRREYRLKSQIVDAQQEVREEEIAAILYAHNLFAGDLVIYTAPSGDKIECAITAVDVETGDVTVLLPAEKRASDTDDGHRVVKAHLLQLL